MMHIVDDLHIEAGFIQVGSPPVSDFWGILTARELEQLEAFEQARRDLPVLGPSSSRAWSRLRRAKPFWLKDRAEIWFVDSGGWATRMARPERTAALVLDGDGRKITFHASRLLDQDKRPAAMLLGTKGSKKGRG